jgi:hypothetical protein
MVLFLVNISQTINQNPANVCLSNTSFEIFQTRDFHGRCDGHAPTLTLIEDTKGNSFGGFTPLEWESRVWNRKHGAEDNIVKADPRLMSFLFTLKNPHNFPARTFPLKYEKKDRAILCDSTLGPRFLDISVSNHCNTNTHSWSQLDGSYANDTGLFSRVGSVSK